MGALDVGQTHRWLVQSICAFALVVLFVGAAAFGQPGLALFRGPLGLARVVLFRRGRWPGCGRPSVGSRTRITRPES